MLTIAVICFSSSFRGKGPPNPKNKIDILTDRQINKKTNRQIFFKELQILEGQVRFCFFYRFFFLGIDLCKSEEEGVRGMQPLHRYHIILKSNKYSN